MFRSICHLLMTAALTLLPYFTRPLDFPHFPESYHARISKYNPKQGSFWGHLIPMEGPPCRRRKRRVPSEESAWPVFDSPFSEADPLLSNGERAAAPSVSVTPRLSGFFSQPVRRWRPSEVSYISAVRFELSTVEFTLVLHCVGAKRALRPRAAGAPAAGAPPQSLHVLAPAPNLTPAVCSPHPVAFARSLSLRCSEAAGITVLDRLQPGGKHVLYPF